MGKPGVRGCVYTRGNGPDRRGEPPESNSHFGDGPQVAFTQVSWKLYTGCLFPRAPITNYHQSGGSKQQKLILLQFWRQEVQNEGVGRVGSPLRLRGRIHSMPLSWHLVFDVFWNQGLLPAATLARCASLQPACVFAWLSSLWASVSAAPFSRLRMLIIGFRACRPRIRSFLLNYILQRSSFQIRFHSQVLRVRTWSWLSGNHNSPYDRHHPSNLQSGEELKQFPHTAHPVSPLTLERLEVFLDVELTDVSFYSSYATERRNCVSA